MKELKITLTLEEYTMIYWALLKMGYLLHWKNDTPCKESEKFYALAQKIIFAVPNEWIDKIDWDWLH